MLQKLLQRYKKVKGKYFQSQLLQILSILLFLYLFGVVVYTLYVPHINSFGCFDECMNYLGGYFLLHGKILYSQIFFNHQPVMAYVSLFILKLFHPINLFIILLRYKQVLIIFGLIADFFIIKRFKLAGIVFAVVFELTKYYLFGDKFLAESFLVYPMVYMTGLVFYKLDKKKVHQIEYLYASIFTWFIIFSREPYILAAIALLVVLVGVPKTRIQKISYVLFISLTSITFLFLPLKEYFYQVFTINSQGVGAADAVSTQLFGIGFFHVFFYPLSLFLGGQFNEFRIVEIAMSFVFCMVAVYLFLQKKQRKMIVLLLLMLGFANLRPIVPGQLFYSSFHFTVWWGMFILLTMLLIVKIKPERKLHFFIGLGVLILATISYLLLSKSFIHYRVDKQTEFAINFGDTYALGETVKHLANPSQTFFIDHMDNVDMAYMESGLVSPYAYSDYGFVAPNYPTYQKAYSEMFAKNPPDFYYGQTLPKSVLSFYQIAFKDKKPSHLYIKKSVYAAISDNKWESVKQFGFTRSND